jgi:hypothetical protein
MQAAKHTPYETHPRTLFGSLKNKINQPSQPSQPATVPHIHTQRMRA